MLFDKNKKEDNQKGQPSEFDKLLLICVLAVQDDREVRKQEERKSKASDSFRCRKNGIYKSRLMRVHIDPELEDHGKYAEGNAYPSEYQQVPVGQRPAVSHIIPLISVICFYSFS